MKTTFQAENPDGIEFTLTITMTLGQFRKIKEDLKSTSYPSDELSRAISSIIFDAQQSFCKQIKEKP